MSLEDFLAASDLSLSDHTAARALPNVVFLAGDEGYFEALETSESGACRLWTDVDPETFETSEEDPDFAAASLEDLLREVEASQ